MHCRDPGLSRPGLGCHEDAWQTRASSPVSGGRRAAGSQSPRVALRGACWRATARTWDGHRAVVQTRAAPCGSHRLSRDRPSCRAGRSRVHAVGERPRTPSAPAWGCVPGREGSPTRVCRSGACSVDSGLGGSRGAAGPGQTLSLGCGASLWAGGGRGGRELTASASPQPPGGDSLTVSASVLENGASCAAAHSHQTMLVGDTVTPSGASCGAPSARPRPTCPQRDSSRRAESLAKGSVVCGQRSPSHWGAGRDCPPGVTVRLEVSRGLMWAGQGDMEGPGRGLLARASGWWKGLFRTLLELRVVCLPPSAERDRHTPPRPPRVSPMARRPGSESGCRRLWILTRPVLHPCPSSLGGKGRV